ncbi:MAG TPA: DUF2334 domain-containing protein [Streptosporangiaceae bacterium]|nr:DUF2334 domain-containing protein [Streptosporangiaceae bacterium]
MRLRPFGSPLLARVLHAGAAVVLVVMTVVIVTESMVRISVTHLFASEIQAPPWRCHLGPDTVPHRRVLVLYDGAGHYASYAAQSAVLAANFASHFAAPVRQSVTRYRAGEMKHFAAVIYVGTTYGERLPGAFLADVRSGRRPVLWLGGNGYQLTDRTFAQAHGWRVLPNDRSGRFATVRYRRASLSITARQLGDIDVTNRRLAEVVGTTVTAAGRRVPWAVRSGRVTYVAEAALQSGGGRDRSYAVADLMASLFGDTQVRHRALIRLEDVGPATSPVQLRQIADLLSARHIPFAVAVYPLYLGPLRQHPRHRITLADRPQVVEALKYMLIMGGTLVLHGYTHQLGDSRNPNNGESGEDYEFLRVHYTAGHVLTYADPVRRDVSGWARHRIRKALAGIRAAGLPRPAIWQFPEYGAAPSEYRVAAAMFVARFDRGNYAERVHGHFKLQTLTEQAPPYLVRDVYGGPVLPENLGYVIGPHVPRSGDGSISSILAAAAAQKAAVRDNVASVYYHPFLGTGPLRRVISGITHEGYRFVSDCSVLKG